MATSAARLLIIVAAALGTSVAAAAQRTFDKRLDAIPGGRLTFEADVGSVAVIGRDADQVIIHAELRGSDSFLERIRITAEQTLSGVVVSVHMRHAGWLGFFDWLDVGSNRVRFDLEVPRDYPVDLRTSGGDIDVRNLNASVRATTSGGGIGVHAVNGTVNVHTSGGGIEAERLQGAARLTTSGGGIDVTDSRGDLYVRTSGGSIRLQSDDGKIDAHTSGGGIRAELRSNQGISLDTSGGSITLLLPKDTPASLDAETSGGRVTSDLPLSTAEVVAGDHLRGSLAGGGAPISLHTSGGSIHLGPE
jgi:hypothetical protein